MVNTKLIVGTEIASLIALTLIFFKVLFMTPNCFNVGDSYFTILPLFMTKALELAQILKN
tara:strand:- start:1712 stop:1891 length:180 start_codon:yes stop_codon:yes gene_type:complete